MRINSCSVIDCKSLSPELFVLEVEFAESIKAGQFVMVNTPDNSLILPRPISVFDYDSKTQKLSLLIRQRGEGTKTLARLQKGDKVQIFGSMGKGFPTDLQNKNILLMGGGEGIAPMLLASKILKQNNNIIVLGGFRYEIESSVLQYFDDSIPTYFTAQDHHEQCSRGLITDLLDDIESPDYIFCCGPIPMMQAIANYVKNKNWNTIVYVSMESHMACGVGACMGCTIKDPNGKALKTCTEGPVFLAEEVFNAIS